MHTCDLSAPEAEAGEFLCVPGQPGLCSETISQKTNRTGEMAERLRVPAALPEDLGLLSQHPHGGPQHS